MLADIAEKPEDKYVRPRKIVAPSCREQIAARRYPLIRIAPDDASHRRGNPTSPRKRGEVKEARERF